MQILQRHARSDRVKREFRGTERYIATEELDVAVKAAMVLSRPLLIKGEPGTGKTLLAAEIAASLAMPLFEWHIKSTTKAQQGLYEYDAVSRLRDSQLGDARVKDIRNYIVKGNLWEAFDCAEQPVAADRRDRQGGHRVPQRPAARARPHGVLRLRDARDGAREAPADHHHHQQQREGAARRVPAALLLPLHPLSRRGDHDADRRRALPGPEARAAARGADDVLQDPRDAGPEEEAHHLGAPRLDQAAAWPRTCRPRSCAATMRRS